MSDISKHTLVIIIIIIIIIISCCRLVTSDQTIVSKYSFQQNQTKNFTQFKQRKKNFVKESSVENLTTLDYYFFTYSVIDHNTLLVKFDITRTILFQSTHILYDAYLYISKLPATNLKIHIGSFSGIYEKELDGTITDHFTFCLVLMPNQQQKKMNNNTFNQNNKTKTIFHQYLRSSYRNQQQQHILHYCTKMGPDEDRYHHQKKQGSKGDHVLLLLQIMMIGIFLIIIQIAHTKKYRKYREAFHQEVEKVRQELRSRKEYAHLSHNPLEILRFAPTIDEEEEEQKEEEDEDENSVTLSHRRGPAPVIKRKRSRSLSPSIDPSNDNTFDPPIEHILESKPWLQIPK